MQRKSLAKGLFKFVPLGERFTEDSKAFSATKKNVQPIFTRSSSNPDDATVIQELVVVTRWEGQHSLTPCQSQ